jgi:hypothetical protein
MLTEEDSRQMQLCMVAEANGDARQPLEHYFAGLHVIEAGPGLMFADRPLAVPEETARQASSYVIEEAPEAWVCAVGDARIDGELPLTSPRANTLH